jgi:hypothetical protein
MCSQLLYALVTIVPNRKQKPKRMLEKKKTTKQTSNKGKQLHEKPILTFVWAFFFWFGVGVKVMTLELNKHGLSMLCFLDFNN